MMKILLPTIVLSCLPIHAATRQDQLDQLAQRGWKHVMEVFYSPKTKLIYTSLPSKVTKARHFDNGLLQWSEGLSYGRGMEDTPILGGLALDMLVDQYNVTKDESLKEEAYKIFQGMDNLVNAHPYKGFLARGLCEEDGKSICALTSRDQHTHFFHGLWNYFNSPLPDDATKAKIQSLFTDIAELMIRNVTEENDWHFLQADGSKDPRGLSKMWNVYPHEASRLPMIYIATWDVTKKQRYWDEYIKWADKTLEASLQLPQQPDSLINGLMPPYAFLQMNTSLELILKIDPDPQRKAKLRQAMQFPAELAAKKAPPMDAGNGRYLCSCAELALTQLLTPDFPFDKIQSELVAKALLEPPVDIVASCRAVHVIAAYWKARANGIEF